MKDRLIAVQEGALYRPAIETTELGVVRFDIAGVDTADRFRTAEAARVYAEARIRRTALDGVVLSMVFGVGCILIGFGLFSSSDPSSPRWIYPTTFCTIALASFIYGGILWKDFRRLGRASDR